MPEEFWKTVEDGGVLYDIFVRPTEPITEALARELIDQEGFSAAEVYAAQAAGLEYNRQRKSFMNKPHYTFTWRRHDK